MMEDEDLFAMTALISPILDGHFYSHLHGRGPIVGIKDPAKVPWQQRQQAFGQFNRGFMGKAGEDDVLQLQGLMVYFLRYVGVGVSMDIDPPTADRIDISLSRIIE
jgi:hypothetical protein